MTSTTVTPPNTIGSRGSTWILSVVVVGISGPMSMITILGDWSRYVSPTRYPARKGFDEFYGYGRLNAYKAVSAAAHGTIPPEAEITAPDWFQQIDPAQSSFALSGYVSARGPYRCEVDVAPTAQPNNAADFRAVASSWCNGATPRQRPERGVLARIGIGQLEAAFPPRDFTGNANGGRPQDSNGRPNTLPYAFTVRVVVRTARGTSMSGEDRRQLFLHRDGDLLPHFPVELHGDGDSAPLLADIDGDNRNELIAANSDGDVHAWRADGTELDHDLEALLKIRLRQT